MASQKPNKGKFFGGDESSDEESDEEQVEQQKNPFSAFNKGNRKA